MFVKAIEEIAVRMVNRDQFVAQLFGLPLEPSLESFFSLGVSGSPDGFVVFGLVLDQGVEDHGDFVRRRGDGRAGTEFGLHAAQVVGGNRWPAHPSRLVPDRRCASPEARSTASITLAARM